MNTSSKNKEDIQGAFSNLFTFNSEREEIEHEAGMMMFQFLSEVEKVMENRKINKKDLAKIIGTSSSYVTQLFRGDKLINFKTLAKIKKGLNLKFEIKIKPEHKDSFKASDMSYNSIFDQKLELPKKSSDLLTSMMKDDTIAPDYPYWSEVKLGVGESNPSLAA